MIFPMESFDIFADISPKSLKAQRDSLTRNFKSYFKLYTCFSSPTLGLSLVEQAIVSIVYEDKAVTFTNGFFAERFNCSLRTVQRAIKSLELNGLIIVYLDASRQNRTLIYSKDEEEHEKWIDQLVMDELLRAENKRLDYERRMKESLHEKKQLQNPTTPASSESSENFNK